MKKVTAKLINVKLKDIIPYDNNSKLHPAKQVAQLRDSILSLGYLNRLEVDEKLVLLAGHGRLMSMKQIDSSGEKKIEVIQYTGLSEDAKRAYRIAHNKHGIDTGFDTEKLGKEFNLLEDTDFFNDTGFSVSEITEIWESDKKKVKSKIIEEEKTSVIEHTCPDCGHSWQVEYKKGKKE